MSYGSAMVVEREIGLVGGPNGENMRILEDNRRLERERKMNLGLRRRDEDINQQHLLDIRNFRHQSELEENRFQKEMRRMDLERQESNHINEREMSNLELNERHPNHGREIRRIDLERQESHHNHEREMRRIDLEAQESHRNHEREMRRINSNFQAHLGILELQRDINTSNNLLQMERINIYSEPNNEKAIKKLNRFILNDEKCKKDKDGNIEINNCCICLNDLKKNEEVVLLSCKHIFHWNCGLNWLKIKNVCPLCRYHIK